MPEALRGFVERMKGGDGLPPGLDAQALEGAGAVDLAARREADLDRLADAIEDHVDLAALFAPDRI